MLDKARELGLALAATPEFLRMKQAQSDVERDEALNALISELHEKRARLVASLGEDELDGNEALSLSNDIERLQGQLQENPLFAELIGAEMAFQALIATVDDEINACIGVGKNECSGNCGSCGGCHH